MTDAKNTARDPERKTSIPDLEVRTVEIVSQDVERREIVGRIMPYGERADLGYGFETFTRGAFGTPDPARVPLKLETGHGHAGPVVGRSQVFDDRSDGLYGTFKVAETRDGNDALELAKMGALGLSAGFLVANDGDSYDRATDTRSIHAASLREVSLVAVPAYVGAELVEIRSATTTEVVAMERDTNPTTTVENPAVPDIEGAVALAVTAAMDEQRSIAANAALEDLKVEAEHRGHEYRSIGDLVSDVILHTRGKSADASDRLTKSIDDGIVEADGSAVNLLTRAFADPGNSVGSASAPDQYIPELLVALREGRPTADLFESRQLPALGNNVDLPAVSVPNTVGYQDGQNTAVESTRQDQIVTTFPKSTIAGGQGMSVQAVNWSSPSYLESVVSDLAAAYSEFLDQKTIDGDPVVDTPVSGTGYTGILNGATDIPVTGDATAAIELIGSGWAAVYAGSRRSPRAAIMDAALWGSFLDQVDSEGRPLVSTEAPSNPVGFGDAGSIIGTLRGLPVVLDDNAGAGNLILGSFRDALLFEDGGRPAQIGLTYPDVLTTDVTVFGFSALAIRRPAAFAVLSGITV